MIGKLHESASALSTKNEISPRGDPHEVQVRRLVAQLKNLGVDIRHQNHQMIVDSVRKVKVDNSGIVLQ